MAQNEDIPPEDIPPEVPPDPFAGGPLTATVVAVASLCLAATVVVTTMQVVLRYGFNNPQTWAEEVSRYLLGWIILLGGGIAVARRSHIRVDILETVAPTGLKVPLSYVQRAIEFFAYSVLLYSGCLVAWEHRASRFYTITNAPQVLFYLAAPVGAALMIIFLLASFRRGR